MVTMKRPTASQTARIQELLDCGWEARPAPEEGWVEGRKGRALMAVTTHGFVMVWVKGKPVFGSRAKIGEVVKDLEDRWS